MIIVQTPLRISFAGGGTDLKDFWKEEEGWVVSSAIDKYVYVIVKERFDDKIYVNYSEKEIVDSVDEIQHELVREAMKMTGIADGIEITTLADIPSDGGSGLGSSSSVTVGLLNAFYAFKGIQQPAELLAQQACQIEIDILGKPIGKQDQYIAAYGGLRFFKFQKNGHVDVEKLPVYNENYRKMGSNLMLFYTGITRSADKILKSQKENTADKIDFLKTIKYQAAEIREYLLTNQFDRMGEVLRKTWECKKQLANGITLPEIESMYRKALEAGALGGKISGAGGGGFLLLYCPREKQNQVREVLKNYREFPFLLEQDGSKVIFNYRRYAWK
ncbi:D-glycero-alpha-D-manno-heptose 7-phosphate kinase [bacterium BMS3Bbin03]|nr:D-glycero-alpha-D-manno-heptose 7-phosphate kinase [bacterium BMS3Bbin03]